MEARGGFGVLQLTFPAFTSLELLSGEGTQGLQRLWGNAIVADTREVGPLGPTPTGG